MMNFQRAGAARARAGWHRSLHSLGNGNLRSAVATKEGETSLHRRRKWRRFVTLFLLQTRFLRDRDIGGQWNLGCWRDRGGIARGGAEGGAGMGMALSGSDLLGGGRGGREGGGGRWGTFLPTPLFRLLPFTLEVFFLGGAFLYSPLGFGVGVSSGPGRADFSFAEILVGVSATGVFLCAWRLFRQLWVWASCSGVSALRRRSDRAHLLARFAAIIKNFFFVA